MVTVAFLHHVQIFLLTYLLNTYLNTKKYKTQSIKHAQYELMKRLKQTDIDGETQGKT